jgi:hypothetical protein
LDPKLLDKKIRSQSKKKPYISNSAPARRRSTLATAVLGSRNFRLYFDTSRITQRQMVIELHGLE